MKQEVIRQYRFNLAYARELVTDLSESQMTQTASKGLENHPAFTLGHLVSGSAMMAQDLGEDLEMPQGWHELFSRNGPGDPRFPDQSANYPSKDELLNELARQHARVETCIMALTQQDLNAPFKWRFSSMLPTLGDLIYFMCVTHEAMHLGQLAAWRRALGMESGLARL